jgi:hypothetical protein
VDNQQAGGHHGRSPYGVAASLALPAEARPLLYLIGAASLRASASKVRKSGKQ